MRQVVSFLDKKNPDEVLGCFFSYRCNHKWGLHKVDGGIGLRSSVLFHVFVKSDHESWAEPGLSFRFFRSKGGRFGTET